MGLESIGTPALWIGFTVFVLVMLALDLGVFHRKAHEVRVREALVWTAVWVSLAIVFNLANAYLNARWIYTLGPARPAAWLVDPRFLGGVAIFACGYWINHQSDRFLFTLRKPGDGGYRIPYGGLFRFVSCPNYFGEIVEWTGWALCTFSPAGLAFALASAANLVPRARAHHRWYRETFADYPPERKAIVPLMF